MPPPSPPLPSAAGASWRGKPAAGAGWRSAPAAGGRWPEHGKESGAAGGGVGGGRRRGQRREGRTAYLTVKLGFRPRRGDPPRCLLPGTWTPRRRRDKHGHHVKLHTFYCGFRMLLTDRSKLLMGIGGVTALAAGVYTTREGARVTWGYINRILGQPSLIRESSMPKFPLSGFKALKPSLASLSGGAGFEIVILHPSLKQRIENLARATENTKSHDAPFRNMLFYGPPGTGKTLVAREMARKSGLDYAMMTGGDVAPLGSEAVTKIHQIFDWAKKSRKGMLLFIDEADAFLCERNSTHMSEAQRSALNALLFRTGDQSRDIVLVLATNRPGDLDTAITDRMDEVIEFPLPGEEERFQLLKLYLNHHMLKEDGKTSSWGSLLNKQQQKIHVKDITDDLLREAARKINGFSGREIAKLMASVQAAVYGRPDCILDPQLFTEIVEYKLAEHHQRIKLASEATT